MRRLRLALVGFGHVGRRFAALLLGPYGETLEARGVRADVTGIMTARHGAAIDARGLPLSVCLARVLCGEELGALHRGALLGTPHEFIDRVPADILVELTPLDPRRGEPATRHVRWALARGLDVVTANKGPVAFAHRALQKLAAHKGVFFRHEGAVMDGVPVFNLVERCLPGNRIDAFSGSLNSTTSHVLSRVAEGASRKVALAEARAMGIAEADPTNDLEGWDSAVKGCAIANVLMGANVRPRDVRRRGVSGLSPATLRKDGRRGLQWRLVVRGKRVGKRVRVSVAPERIGPGDPLAGSGPDAALLLKTSLLGEIGILERGGTVDQTAYAILSDIVAVLDSRAALPRSGR
jgi:homoserine dehydrogenase